MYEEKKTIKFVEKVNILLLAHKSSDGFSLMTVTHHMASSASL